VAGLTRTLPLCLLALTVLSSPAWGQADLEATLKAEEARLDSLERAHAAARKRWERAQDAAESVTDRLSDLEREIFLTRREHAGLARREASLTLGLKETRQEAGSLGTRVTSRQAGLSGRLRDMYKRGRVSGLSVFFSSGTLLEGVRKLEYLARAAAQDKQDVAGLRADRQQLKRVMDREAQELRHQRALVKAKSNAERTLGVMGARFERDRRRYLSRAKVEKEAMVSHQTALEASKARIIDLVQEIERLRRLGGRLVELPAFDILAHQGRLAWPVRGRILERFGRYQDPELKTWTFRRGVSIAASEDTDVLAIAPGEVMVVDWYRGYGQFVLLRHPGGFYSLYAHLGSVRANVGEILAEGAVVGTIGDSGRLDGVPQLHFEVIRGEEALDPEEWLAK